MKKKLVMMLLTSCVLASTFSLTVYVIMCVLLIVAETAVGAPLAAWYVSKLGTAMSKVSFLASDIEGWCNILSIIT